MRMTLGFWFLRSDFILDTVSITASWEVNQEGSKALPGKKSLLLLESCKAREELIQISVHVKEPHGGREWYGEKWSKFWCWQ